MRPGKSIAPERKSGKLHQKVKNGKRGFGPTNGRLGEDSAEKPSIEGELKRGVTQEFSWSLENDDSITGVSFKGREKGGDKSR